jgi:DNA-binding transcriptional MerR regulator
MTTLLGFSSEQVCRLTGLSGRQLHYWDNTGFFSPWRMADEPRRPYNRVYSFRDVVGLRTIAILRNVHHVPLQELRKVGEWLAGHCETPWASLVFFVGGRKVYFEDPTGVLYAGRRPTQTALRILLSAVEEDVNETANRLRQRLADDIGQIHRNRFVVSNAPCIAGTRIPT